MLRTDGQGRESNPLEMIQREGVSGSAAACRNRAGNLAFRAAEMPELAGVEKVQALVKNGARIKALGTR